MKRFLKIVGILTLFAAVFGYFGFRILFFDPFEGEFEGTERLVPRDVHVMVRRSDLEKDFDPFPHPAFFQGLKVHPAWRQFSETELYQEYETSWGLAEKVAELEAQLAEVEGFFDIVDDVLGREVMVVGRHDETGELKTALLFRGSFRTKFFAEAVRHGWIRGFMGDQLKEYREEGSVAVVTTADGTELGVLRRQDLVVVGDGVRLVSDIADMMEGDGYTLADSPYYVKALEEKSDVGRPVDFAVDLGAVSREREIATIDVGENAPVHLEWLSRTLIPGDFGIVAGRLFLGDDIDLAVRGSGDMAQIRKNAGGLYDGSPGRTEDLYRFCGSVFPKKTFACGYLKIDIRDFLLKLLDCLDAETLDNLNSGVQKLKRHPDGRNLPISTAADLVEYAQAFFGDEVIFGFEPQDTYQLPPAPDEEPRTIVPHKSWGPRIAILIPVIDRTMAETTVQMLLDTAEDGATKYGWNYKAWNQKFSELEFGAFEDPSVCAGIVDFEPEGFDKREFLVITTTGQFLDEIIRVRHGEYGHPSLLESGGDYAAAPDDLQDFSQGFMWVSSEGTKRALRDLVEWWSEGESKPDYGTLRPEAIRVLRDERYPDRRGRPLDPEDYREFEAAADREMEEVEFRWRNDELPRYAEERLRDLSPIDLFDWAVLTFRATDRDVAVRLHARTAAKFPQ